MADHAVRNKSSDTGVDKVNLYVYVVVYDHGFAPNPHFGYCTLATCKPGIRKGARLGDWIAGIGSHQKSQAGKLVFAMKVQEALFFEDYWADPRFRSKRPHRSGSLKLRYGDNIYHRSTDRSEWIQEDGAHSCPDGSMDPRHVLRDTSAPRVLISQDFAYFGGSAIDLPERFWSWEMYDLKAKLGRNYLCNFPSGFKKAFIEWLETLPRGVGGEPSDWPSQTIRRRT